MYARKQVLIWTALIFVLNLVLLTKLRDNAATARTQLEELTPTELTQIDIANLLEPAHSTLHETVAKSSPKRDRSDKVKAEESSSVSQFSLSAENRSAGSVEVYYVHKGDTLWRISRRHNLDLQILLAYNNLKNPNLIRPGQRIEIPRRHINMQVSP
ncbi:MAG: LysM peptidoglycan-binding domain-containing protein [Proteobacteria bacterium]|nr:LysM peptidoglycan-binding domain-containing protein [Pseudomonadota bacterium]